MLINQMSVKRVKNWLSNFDILISDNMNWGKLAIKFLKMDLLQIFPRQRVNLIANFPKSHHMLSHEKSSHVTTRAAPSLF